MPASDKELRAAFDALRDVLVRAFEALDTQPTPAPDPDPLPEPPPVPSKLHPSDVLDLTKWTIMLPTGSQGDPDNDYVIDKSIPGVLFVDPADGAVVFRVDVVDGVHSGGSKYPRTEARQMADADWKKAAWPSSGSHSLECDLAIDTSHLSTRRRVNAMQLHDGADDVCQLMFREDGKLGLAHNDGNSFEVIDAFYRNGTRFTCKILAEKNRIKVFYNGVQKADISKAGTGWFAKFGTYAQTGGSSTYKEPSGSYAEVKVWRYAISGDPAK